MVASTTPNSVQPSLATAFRTLAQNMPDGTKVPLMPEVDPSSRMPWWRGVPCLLLTMFILVVGMITTDLFVAHRFGGKGGVIRRAVVNQICPKRNVTVVKPAPSPVAVDLDAGEAAATFVITCGTQETDAVDEMQPLVKSILLLSSRPIRLVFFTDADGVTRIQKMFSDLGHANRLVRVEIHHLTNAAIESFAARMSYDPYGHHSGRWGTAKLMVPWLLPNEKRVLVLDTDMILLEDPIHLWSHFDDGEGWTYQMPLYSRYHPANICSCIVLINCERARQQGLYPKVMIEALKTSPPAWITKDKIYRPAHGDQGLYWLMMRRQPKMFRELPRKWDVDKCHRFYGVFKNGSKAKASLLHRNCGGTNTDANSLRDEASPFFQFFIHYQWHWLQAPKGKGYQVIVSNFEHGSQLNFSVNSTSTT